MTKAIVALGQPEVMRAAIKAATDCVPITTYDRDTDMTEVVGYTNGDVKAMEMIFKVTGAMPTPKSASTTINLNQMNNGVASKQTAELSGEKCDAPLSMDAYLMELQSVVRPKSLAPPSVATEIPENAPMIDSEYLDVEV